MNHKNIKLYNKLKYYTHLTLLIVKTIITATRFCFINNYIKINICIISFISIWILNSLSCISIVCNYF